MDWHLDRSSRWIKRLSNAGTGDGGIDGRLEGIYRDRCVMSSAVPGPCDEGIAASALPCANPYPRATLAATILGSSVAFIDGSVVNVALPALARDLGAGPADLTWTINAYLLPLGALILLGGSTGDHFGRVADGPLDARFQDHRRFPQRQRPCYFRRRKLRRRLRIGPARNGSSASSR
jgi:hypothetical protein